VRRKFLLRLEPDLTAATGLHALFLIPSVVVVDFPYIFFGSLCPVVDIFSLSLNNATFFQGFFHIFFPIDFSLLSLRTGRSSFGVLVSFELPLIYFTKNGFATFPDYDP